MSYGVCLWGGGTKLWLTLLETHSYLCEVYSPFLFFFVKPCVFRSKRNISVNLSGKLITMSRAPPPPHHFSVYICELCLISITYTAIPNLVRNIYPPPPHTHTCLTLRLFLCFRRFALGAKYAVDKDSSFRAKVNNSSEVGLGYQQRIRNGEVVGSNPTGGDGTFNRIFFCFLKFVFFLIGECRDQCPKISFLPGCQSGKFESR